jgi:hypothetical protein
MTTMATILLLMICTCAGAQVKQYQCTSYSVRGDIKEDTVNISIMDSVLFIELPGHDHQTMHRYTLKIMNITSRDVGTVYRIVFSSGRKGVIIINAYHIYFRHDREEYLYYIGRMQEF